MTEVAEGTLLWEPSEGLKENTNIARYLRWLKDERDLSFEGYAELWDWSVTDLEGYWSSLWEYCGVRPSKHYERVLGRQEMPGAEWFVGAELNYAEHTFIHAREDEPALVHESELRPRGEVSWRELRESVSAVAAALRGMGVDPGDRVVAYVPNVPEAVVAFLACASIGAVWSSCSPDFGAGSVVDRFAQIEPKVLFAVDG